MKRWLLATLAVALVAGGSARADLTVLIPDVNVMQDGTGFLDVLIQSSDGSPQALAQAGYEFLITRDTNVLTMAPTTTTLEFVVMQPSDYMTFGNYVFPDSGNVKFGIDPNGTVTDSDAMNTNNRFDGGDNNLDAGNMLEDVTISGPTQYLLIRLAITAQMDDKPVEGDTFLVTLVPSSGIGSFQDMNGTDIPFTSTTGRVTITARAVPEPGALALLATGGLACALWSRRPRASTHT